MVPVADEEERRLAHLAALRAHGLEQPDLLADADAQPPTRERQQDTVDPHRDVDVEPRARLRSDEVLEAALDRIQPAPARLGGRHARTLPRELPLGSRPCST